MTTQALVAPRTKSGRSRPLEWSASAVGERERARQLVVRHGWNSTSYQVLGAGMRHWTSPSGDALVGYAEHAGVRLVAGAPVADEERLVAAARGFERQAHAEGFRVAYFAAEERFRTLTEGYYAAAVVGFQPVWDVGPWRERFDGSVSLRAQRNRARNKGVVVEAVPLHGGAVPARDVEDLRACLRSWLAVRPLPALGYLTAADPLGLLREDAIARQAPESLGCRTTDRMLFVARLHGRVVAYLVASPVPARRGWMVEQVVRGAGAPNGTTESLVDACARALAEAGAARLTLGLAPLARRVGAESAEDRAAARTALVAGTPTATEAAAVLRDPTPTWLRCAFRWAYSRGGWLYDFAGLEAFKAKFRPDRWEPVYLLSDERELSPRTMVAVAAAFTGGRPLRTVASGIGRAVGRGRRRSGPRARR